MFHVPHKYRIRDGRFGSTDAMGNYGAFYVPNPFTKTKIKNNTFCVIASEGLGWEHVSVSLLSRCPTWQEMCHVKGIFWDDEDCVVQFHPAKSQYVNNHEYCLHLWRCKTQEFPTPESMLIGFTEEELK